MHVWIESLVYAKAMRCSHEWMKYLLCEILPSPCNKMDHVLSGFSWVFVQWPLTSPGATEDQPFHRLHPGKTQQGGEEGSEGTFCVLDYHIIQLNTISACSSGITSFRVWGGGQRKRPWSQRCRRMEVTWGKSFSFLLHHFISTCPSRCSAQTSWRQPWILSFHTLLLISWKSVGCSFKIYLSSRQTRYRRSEQWH